MDDNAQPGPHVIRVTRGTPAAPPDAAAVAGETGRLLARHAAAAGIRHVPAPELAATVTAACGDMLPPVTFGMFLAAWRRACEEAGDGPGPGIMLPGWLWPELGEVLNPVTGQPARPGRCAGFPLPEGDDPA